ncbi:MAG: hypothetical protein K2K38_02900 [Clostridia bacterium]|nr:hypothetical protein [Clostridia bacterium]
MKKKLSARQITLISLICALVCALIAGFAFMGLTRSESTNGTADGKQPTETAEIVAPDKTAKPTAVSVPFYSAEGGYIYLSSDKSSMEVLPSAYARKIYVDSYNSSYTFWTSDTDWFIPNTFGGGSSRLYFIVPANCSQNYCDIYVKNGSTTVATLSFSVSSGKMSSEPYYYDDDIGVRTLMVNMTYLESTIEDGEDFLAFCNCPDKLNISIPSGWTIASRTIDWVNIYPPANVASGNYTITISSSSYVTLPNGTITLTVKLRKFAYDPYWPSSLSHSHTWTTGETRVTKVWIPTTYYVDVTWPTGFSYTQLTSSTSYVSIAGSTAAKEYTISYKPKSGYVWTNDTSTAKTITYTINKAALSSTLSSPSLTTTSFTWSSSRQSTTIKNYSSYTDVTFSSTDLTNSGSTLYVAASTAVGSSYKVYISPDSNHTWSDGTTTQKTLTLSVTRAAINVPTLSKSSTDWSSSKQDFTISTTSYISISVPTGWERDGTKITIPASKAVGSYNVSVTPDSNHKWSDGTTTAKNLPISIGQASISCPTLSKSSTTYSTGSQDITISTMTYISSVSLPTGWKRSGTTVTIPAGEDVGSYDIWFYADSNHTFSGDSSDVRSISITAKSLSSTTVTLSQTTYTYDGNAKSPTVTVKDGSVTLTKDTDYTVAYSSNTNAGTGKVTVTGKGNYSGTEEPTFTINKATPTVSASVGSGTWYIGNKLGTVTIAQGSISTAGSFNWTSPDTVLTASGTYEWTFTPSDTDNYNTVKGELKVTAVPSISSITVTGAKTSYIAFEAFTTSGMTVKANYGNGTSNTVSPTSITTPYDGRTNKYFLASDNGSTVTISYTESGTTKTATLTITVSKATYNMSNVSWNYSSPFTYDGTEKTVTLQNLPTGVTANYSNNKKTNADSYVASVSSWNYDTANYNAPSFSTTCSWKINKATYSMTNVRWNYTSAFTYDGNVKTVSLSNLPTGVTANYSNNSKTDADTYIASVSSWNYDTTNYNEPVFTTTCTWTINKATYSMSNVSWNYSGPFTYDGTEKTVALQNLPTGVTVKTYSNNAKTEAGDYTASVTAWNYDTVNHNAPSFTTPCNWKIDKASYNMSNAGWNYTSAFTYDGTAKTVTVQGLPTGVTVKSYSDNSKTDAGDYTASVTLNYDTKNYNAPTIANCSWTISKATPEVEVNVSAGTYYIGDYLNDVSLSLVSSTVTGTVKWTYSTSQLTGERVEYDWTFTPSSDYTKNYNNVTGKYLIAAVYKVTKIEINLDKATTDYTAFDTLDEDSIVITATYLLGKNPTVVTWKSYTYPNGEHNYFIAADNGKKVVFTYEENGITVTCSLTITVGKKAVDMTGVSMSNKTETYTGNPFSITINGTLNADLISLSGYTYNGESATSATDAGTYTVAAVFVLVDSANYKMPELSATLTINKATSVLDVTGVTTSYTYNGELQKVESGATVNNTEQTSLITYTNNTFTTVAEGNGKVVTISVAATKNYLAASETVTLSVAKAEVSLTWTGGDGVYDGKEHNATLTVASGVFDRDASAVTTDTLKPYLTVSYTATAGGNAERTHVGTYAPSYTGYPAGEPFCNYAPKVTNPEYTFSITEATVTGITFTGDTFGYDGTSHSIEIAGTLPDEVTVKYTLDGKEFNGVTDVKRDENGNVVDYTIIAEFACESGNYTVPASLSATITITPRKIANGEVSGVDSKYTYKGEAWKPEPVVELTLDGAASSVTLDVEDDYTVDYSTTAYVAGTTVVVTVEGVGNYTGTVTKTFTIERATITMEWVGTTFTYNGEGQGVTVNFSGIAESDSTTVVPQVTYKGRSGSSTNYDESPVLPVDAGNYTVTVTFELNNDNYISKIISGTFKHFEIEKAHVDVDVEFVEYEQGDKVYAGGALPAIDLKELPLFNGTAVKGSVDWQKSGNVPPSLKAGTNAYVWVFTPEDVNFRQTTGTLTVYDVVMPDIADVSVVWKNGTQPRLFTSTTLEKVREYLVVTGEMDKGLSTIDIADYELTGSWGSGDKPSTDGRYTLTITVTVSDNIFIKTLDDVKYDEVLLSKITVTAVDGGSIKKSYEAFDEFDKSSIIVTAVYSDGEEVVVEDYQIAYPEGRDCFWAADKDQSLTITYMDATPVTVDGISVAKKSYDLSGLSIDKTKTETYDGEVKSYAIKGTFGLGTVKYTYGKYDDNGEWQTVATANVKNAGTYVVRVEFTIVGDENIANYNAIEMQEVTLVINKATYDNVDAIGFVGNSADYDLGKSLAEKTAVQNVPDGVTVVYEYKDASGKVLSADEVVNAGVYTVTAKFVTDENHSGIAPMTNKFTVNKAKPAVNPIVGGSLSKGTKLYELTFADDGAIKGTFKWVNDEQELQAGVNRCHYVFTPEDSANYETVSGYIDLSVGALSEGDVTANGGNLSAGLTAAIIVSMAACLAVAIIALLIALKKPKTSDNDGFYEPATEEDMK